jgi:hypothetical protein
MPLMLAFCFFYVKTINNMVEYSHGFIKGYFHEKTNRSAACC